MENLYVLIRCDCYRRAIPFDPEIFSSFWIVGIFHLSGIPLCMPVRHATTISGYPSLMARSGTPSETA
jgi:hypothetical protein